MKECCARRRVHDEQEGGQISWEKHPLIYQALLIKLVFILYLHGMLRLVVASYTQVQYHENKHKSRQTDIKTPLEASCFSICIIRSSLTAS